MDANFELAHILQRLCQTTMHNRGSAELEQDNGKNKKRCRHMTTRHESLQINDLIDHFLGKVRIGAPLEHESTVHAFVMDFDDQLPPISAFEGTSACVFMSKSGRWQAWYFLATPAKDAKDDYVNAMKQMQSTYNLGDVELFPKGNACITLPGFGIESDTPTKLGMIYPKKTDDIAEILSLVKFQRNSKLPIISKLPPPPNPSEDDTPRPAFTRDIEVLTQALDHIQCDSLHYDDWLRCVFAVKNTYKDEENEEAAFELLHAWSSADQDRYDEQKLDQQLNQAARKGPGSLSIGTIFYMAKQRGWSPPEPITVNDAYIVRLFVEKYGHRYRAVPDNPKTARWMKYNPELGHWQPRRSIFDELVSIAEEVERKGLDTLKVAEHTASAIEAERLSRIGQSMITMAERLKNKKKIEDVEASIIKSHSAALVMSPAQFDCDGDLIGVLNGTLNLQSGELVEPKPQNYISRSLGASWIDRTQYEQDWDTTFAKIFVDGLGKKAPDIQQNRWLLLGGQQPASNDFPAFRH